MRLFLSFLGWFFGLIFLAGSVPYFWCGEFFLGLWSLVVVIILIPPLYKYASGRFKFSYSKPKIMVFSLIIFFALFANFVRPLFPDYIDKSEFTKHQLEAGDFAKEVKLFQKISL